MSKSKEQVTCRRCGYSWWSFDPCCANPDLTDAAQALSSTSQQVEQASPSDEEQAHKHLLDWDADISGMAYRDLVKRFAMALAQARREAYERAANLCDMFESGSGPDFAKQIRSLKERG